MLFAKNEIPESLKIVVLPGLVVLYFLLQCCACLYGRVSECIRCLACITAFAGSVTASVLKRPYPATLESDLFPEMAKGSNRRVAAAVNLAGTRCTSEQGAIDVPA